MGRYLDADEDFVRIFLEVVEERFPTYQNLNIKLLFDLKKRTSKGLLVLASIEPVTEKLRYFSKDSVAVDGYDYILSVNKKTWEVATEKDRKRLISHELRHIYIDENGKCKTVGHEINDFYDEVALNQDDPMWGAKLTGLVCDIYEQEKEMNKSSKKELVL